MVAVIGDVHGCFYTLLELYNQIRKKYSGVPIYCVGDLVDRGLHSHKVLNFIQSEKISFTPGNHDYMFYHFFKDPSSLFARSWVFNGNETTLASYEDYEDAVFKHINIIKEAPLYYDLEDCFICHAGISNAYAKILSSNYKDNLKELRQYIYEDYQSDKGVLWTRDDLLDLGKLQIVGHTKQREITYVEESRSLYIDTGACVGNKLSAVLINKGEIVDTIVENTHVEDIII